MSIPNPVPDHDQQDHHDHVVLDYDQQVIKPELSEQLLLVKSADDDDGDHDDDEEEEEEKEKYKYCRTPTSDDQKIPKIQSCPPTPRKQASQNKRKFSELQFFESTARQEVESFFRSTFQQLTSHNYKKRCKSV